MSAAIAWGRRTVGCLPPLLPQERKQRPGEACSRHADRVGSLGGMANVPLSRASLYLLPPHCPMPPPAPLSNLLTVLSVPGQDTNSWSSRMRILQFARPIFLSESPPWGAERPGENKAAGDGGWAQFPKFSPRTRTQLNIPAKTPSWYPTPRP